jgi:hypothetical protein
LKDNILEVGANSSKEQILKMQVSNNKFKSRSKNKISNKIWENPNLCKGNIQIFFEI